MRRFARSMKLFRKFAASFIVNSMSRLLLLALACCALLPLSAARVRSIVRYGARPADVSRTTRAFQRAYAAAADGDTIFVPRGVWPTATVVLRSHTVLFLAEGAVLRGAEDLDLYRHYQPSRPMTRYDSGLGTCNANAADDARWTRALILGQGVTDVTICGRGTIDGGHLTDALGEEGMRGPHALLLAEADHVAVRGVTITRASNYAVLGYDLADCTFADLRIREGWDGIHIRGGRDILIARCDLLTGDDAIAGCYLTHCRITDCHISSSCHGLRLIGPAEGLDIGYTLFDGPGVYPHRTALASSQGQAVSPPAPRSLYAVLIEPGAWGQMPGAVSGVCVHDCTMYHLTGAVAFTATPANPLIDITLRRLHLHGLTVPLPLNRWETSVYWERITQDACTSTSR